MATQTDNQEQPASSEQGDAQDTSGKVSLDKLNSQVTELRAAMIAALTAGEDSKARKLGNELAAINKDILDYEANAQVADRTAYTTTQDDAISPFEVAGFNLAVNFETGDDGDKWIIAYTPSGDLIQQIKAAATKAKRPSSVTKYKYYTDEKGARQFDLGKSSSRNGTRTAGWLNKDGETVQLGVAFDAVATAAQKRDMNAMDTASKQNAFKVTTVGNAGYTKK